MRPCCRESFDSDGLARFGRLIEYIPVSVTLGFTSGIGITIGTMQIKDFLGLQMAHVPEHYLQKVGALFYGAADH